MKKDELRGQAELARFFPLDREVPPLLQEVLHRLGAALTGRPEAEPAGEETDPPAQGPHPTQTARIG